MSEMILTPRMKGGRPRKKALEAVSVELIPAAPVVISSESREMSPEEGLRMARDKVHAAMPSIIEKMLEVAKSGSCQHAKFLLEFARDEQEAKAAATVDEDEESLAALLLREIREAEAEEQAAG